MLATNAVYCTGFHDQHITAICTVQGPDLQNILGNILRLS